MLSIVCTVSSYAPPVAPAVATTRAASPSMETVDDLKTLSTKLNPAVGYYNPTPLLDMDFWGQGQAATIGFLRHAELKHGRVAMAGFVGFCVQSNGISWPWPLQGGAFGGETIQFADIAAAGGPGDQWDALPSSAKLQIIIFVGFLEFWRELKAGLDGKHYMKGGAPGVMPDFIGSEIEQLHKLPLSLWDPAGFTKKMSAEKRATSLLAEVNNGRLAMIGIMSIMAAQKVEGSVPALAGLIKPYAGDVMAPFIVGS